MNYGLLENTGLRVLEIALGTMTLGKEACWVADKETS